MNGRIIKAALAGAGALVLLGAGTTYASFTGSTSVAGRATAGTFDVTVSPSSTFTSAASLMPGQSVSQDFKVTTRSGASAGKVLVELTDRVDIENGCASDSEKAVDTQCALGTPQTPAAQRDRGDLANQAVVTAVRYTPSGGRCDSSAYNASTAARTKFGGLVAPTTSAAGYRPDTSSLAALDDADVVADLPATGAATCVRVTMTLQDLAGNENDWVQGDTVEFTVRLGLTQAAVVA